MFFCFFFTYYLKKAFAALTGTDSVVLTGCIVPADGTATLTGCWILGFVRHHVSLHCTRAFHWPVFHGYGGAMKCGDMLLVRQEEGVVLSQLSIMKMSHWWMLFLCGTKGEKGELLGHGSLISHRGGRGRRVGAVRGIPGRCRLCLKAWCYRWGRAVNWTSIVIWATWWQCFIEAAKCKGAWITAIHLEFIQLEGLVLHLSTWAFSYCGGTERCREGGWRSGNLAGIRIKLPRIAISH